MKFACKVVINVVIVQTRFRLTQLTYHPMIDGNDALLLNRPTDENNTNEFVALGSSDVAHGSNHVAKTTSDRPNTN